MQSVSDISVLLAEDDVRLSTFVAEYLEQRGVSVVTVADGETALRTATAGHFDVVLLDWMLPQRDGMSVCRELRKRSDVPVIILTARSEESDRVLGLELGADDYLTKPFSPRELLARIQGLVRRARGQVGPARSLKIGPLEIQLEARSVTLRGAPVELTSYEFDILRVLAERRGRVLSREQILELATGSAEDAFDRSIDVRISRLRQKIGDDPRHPTLLRTVRGAGYLLAAEEP